MNSQNCELVNINGQIVAFCKTTDFTQYVRQAINNEMFWRELLQRYSISDMVRTELNNTVPRQVKNEAQNIIGPLVRDQLDNYTKIQIPSHVAKSLSEQITGFLNNHVQMNQILINHSSSLNQQLYNSATETLARVVNEEQYHQVTSAHLNAMNTRFDNYINDLQKKTESLLASYDQRFNQKLQDIQNQVNKELESLVQTNIKVKEQETKINDLQNNLFLTKVTFGVSVVALCSIFLYLSK